MFKIIIYMSCLVFFLQGCTSVNHKKNRIIHPKVFDMVECWLSDTAYPIVTEFNLTAIEKDRNQFPYDEIKIRKNWVLYCRDDNQGYVQYKVLLRKENYYKILFASNGGGSLTTSRGIEFVIKKKNIIVNDKVIEIDILQILSIKSLPCD